MDTDSIRIFCSNGTWRKLFDVLSPQSVLENVDVKAKGVDYLVYMWAARQFALGFIFAFATFKKSIPMLTLAYIFFLVMFVGDFVIGILQKENTLIISALVMCVISSVLLFVINKRNNGLVDAKI